MNEARTFLVDNQIFFETIVMVVLTVAGIYLSFSANKIMTKQTSIEEALSKPIINLEAIYNDADNTKVDEVSIQNNGAVLGDINIEVYPYFYMILYNKVSDKGMRTDSLILPIENGMNTVFLFKQLNLKSGIIGKVSKSASTSEYIHDFELFDEFYNDGISITGLRLAFVSLECFIKINYTDAMGNQKSEEYQFISGYNHTFDMKSILFIREGQILSLPQNGLLRDAFSQIEVNDILNKDNLTKYLRYGESVNERYNQFIYAITDAHARKQFFLNKNNTYEVMP